MSGGVDRAVPPSPYRPLAAAQRRVGHVPILMSLIFFRTESS